MEENENNVIVDQNENVESTSGIEISGDVVAVIAGVAVSEVPGVSSMTGAFAGITEAISGKKNMAKGIKVDIDPKGAKIDVNIVVEYGTRIPDAAFEIQNRVKKSVEAMTGLKVLEVNIHVQGVMTRKDEKKEESPVEEKETTEE